MSDTSDLHDRTGPRDGFAAALMDIADAGSAKARPFPAASVHARGRARQRRQWLTVAASGVTACVVAAGVVALGHGSGADRVAPVSPTSTANPSYDPMKFLRAGDLPLNDTLHWKGSTPAKRQFTSYDFTLCGWNGRYSGSAGVPTADIEQYTSVLPTEKANESIYHFGSAQDAANAYAALRPDQAACDADKPSWVVDVTPTAAVNGGFGWEQNIRRGQDEVQQHIVAALSGREIAVFFYEKTSAAPAYSVEGDQPLLQRLSALVGGPNPQPVETSPPPGNGAIPASAWLKADEFPFAGADQSHGWYVMSPPSAGQGGPTPADLCANAPSGIIDSTNATVAGQSLHGTPDTVPLHDNYLYSGASQGIMVYPDAAAAQAAFSKAETLLTTKSCHVKGDYFTGTRTITPGVHTATAFSAAIDDAASSHMHEYVVLKGKTIVEVGVSFEAGANNTDFGKDRALVDLIASKLP